MSQSLYHSSPKTYYCYENALNHYQAHIMISYHKQHYLRIAPIIIALHGSLVCSHHDTLKSWQSHLDDIAITCLAHKDLLGSDCRQEEVDLLEKHSSDLEDKICFSGTLRTMVFLKHLAVFFLEEKLYKTLAEVIHRQSTIVAEYADISENYLKNIFKQQFSPQRDIEDITNLFGSYHLPYLRIVAEYIGFPVPLCGVRMVNTTTTPNYTMLWAPVQFLITQNSRYFQFPLESLVPCDNPSKNIVAKPCYANNNGTLYLSTMYRVLDSNQPPKNTIELFVLDQPQRTIQYSTKGYKYIWEALSQNPLYQSCTIFIKNKQNIPEKDKNLSGLSLLAYSRP